jgi:hypothetical protein
MRHALRFSRDFIAHRQAGVRWSGIIGPPLDEPSRLKLSILVPAHNEDLTIGAVVPVLS